MITANIKDKILTYIVNKDTLSLNMDARELSKELDIKSDIICAVIEYFGRKGFCQINSRLGCCGSEKYIISLNVEAYDMYRNGGLYLWKI